MGSEEDAQPLVAAVGPDLDRGLAHSEEVADLTEGKALEAVEEDGLSLAVRELGERPLHHPGEPGIGERLRLGHALGQILGWLQLLVAMAPEVVARGVDAHRVEPGTEGRAGLVAAADDVLQSTFLSINRSSVSVDLEGLRAGGSPGFTDDSAA